MKIMSKEWRKLSRAEKNKYFKRWKQVQNGEGYYDASGTFHFYENWRDD